MSTARLRARLRAVYVVLSSPLVKQHFLRALMFTAKADALSSFERHFATIGWLVSNVKGIVLAEGSLIHPIPLLISLLFTVFFAIATILGRDIISGILTIFFIFISLTLYSIRPIIAVTKIDEKYIAIADPEEGYLNVLSFLKNIEGEIIEEKSFIDKGLPVPKLLESYTNELKKYYEKVQEQTRMERVAVVTQPTEVKVTRPTPLSSELANLMDEVSKWRNYLEKLEELRTQGKISEKAYEELKKEYLNKLKELEKKIEELQKSLGSSS